MTSHYLPFRTLSAKDVLFMQLPCISRLFPSGFDFTQSSPTGKQEAAGGGGGGEGGECTEDELECLRQVNPFASFFCNLLCNWLCKCFCNPHLANMFSSLLQCSGDPWRAKGGLPNLLHLYSLQTEPQEPRLSRIWKINDLNNILSPDCYLFEFQDKCSAY